MAKEKICGIYCIFNKINHKRYIGQSVDIKARWSKHKKSLSNKTLDGDNKHLTSAWHKYGEKNFEFFIIEKCERFELDFLEIFWINYYDSLNPAKGYNKTKGGKRDYVITYSEKDKANISKSYGENHATHILSEEDVKQILKLFEMGKSSGSIAKQYNVHRSTITHIRNHKSWTYLTDGLDIKQSDYCNKHGFTNSHAKSVDMYTLDGMYLQTYSSINQIAEELKVKNSAISNVCYGKTLSLCGYTFRFHNCDFNSVRTESRRGKRRVAIDQYDLDWNYICSYKTISEAARVINKDPSTINHILNYPNKTAGGYHWLRHGEQPPIAI